jgi:hypothetical protein
MCLFYPQKKTRLAGLTLRFSVRVFDLFYRKDRNPVGTSGQANAKKTLKLGALGELRGSITAF